MARPKNKTGVNLLGADGAPMTTPKKAAPEEGPAPWVSFWKPNMTISVVDHFNTYAQSQVPPQVSAALCMCRWWGLARLAAPCARAQPPRARHTQRNMHARVPLSAPLCCPVAAPLLRVL